MTLKPQWQRTMDKEYIEYLEAIDLEDRDADDIIETLSAHGIEAELVEEVDYTDLYWERVRENREEEMTNRRQAWGERYL